MAITVKEYFAKVGSRFTDEDARIIGPELEKLGPVSAAEIVDAARDESSPLHPYFEWDDSVAAEAYRREQAREMVQSIEIRVVTKDAEEKRVRAFHSVNLIVGEKEKERKYLSHFEVRENRQTYEQVVQEALRYLKTWQSRYEIYCSLYPEFGRMFRPVFEGIRRMEKTENL